ncbi:MAG: RsmD family RNA methyltransferase, partial [Prevotella sp.]|nr:RsmD family RNA methyltransferase [Prevotella sp.]
IQECLKKLGTKVCIPIRGDVFRFLKSCRQQYDFIFADPPYALKELPQLPDLVLGKQLLNPEGIFVLEHGKDCDFSQHPHFVEHRSYGSVNFSLFTAAERTDG